MPAAATVLVRLPIGTDPTAAVRRVATVGAVAPPVARRAPILVPAVYDGADLEQVARSVGCSRAEVVARHAAATYEVAFVGFAPGFAYLIGGDPFLRVARRDTPRPVVPAGSIALADGYTGIYPRSSPGGWQLIGRTELVLFAPDAEPPSPFEAGVTVRFVDAGRA